MMQLGEFPTEQELKTMVAEVDQVMIQLVTHLDDLCYLYLDFCDDHFTKEKYSNSNVLVMMAKTIYNNEKSWDTNWDINHLLINSALLPFQDKNGTIELDEFLNMMATRLIICDI